MTGRSRADEVRPTPTARRVALLVAATMLFAVVVAAAAAVLSGTYQVRPVLSGSMRPGLPVGGAVVTHRVPVTSLHQRDVIVFHPPDHPRELVVHRIVAISSGPDGPVVQTQGDANDAPDPWRLTLHGDAVYQAQFSLPLVGYASVWMHSPTGRRSLLVVGLLLVAAAVFGRRLPWRKRPIVEKAAGSPRSSAQVGWGRG
jgi:signal peptidase I